MIRMLTPDLDSRLDVNRRRSAQRYVIMPLCACASDVISPLVLLESAFTTGLSCPSCGYSKELAAHLQPCRSDGVTCILVVESLGGLSEDLIKTARLAISSDIKAKTRPGIEAMLMLYLFFYFFCFFYNTYNVHASNCTHVHQGKN